MALTDARSRRSSRASSDHDRERKHDHSSGDHDGDAGTDNLRTAIEGESHEIDVIYPSYAEHARAAGDVAAADRLEEIRRDELDHLEAFREALESIA